MANVLVAYTTNAGSTQKVAETIARELVGQGLQAEVHRLEEINNLEGYSAAVIGAPMILGWHRSAVRFVKKFRQELSQVPVAYFMTALSLTSDSEGNSNNLPVCLDPELAKLPKGKRLSVKERYTSVSNYLNPVLAAGPGLKPVSIGFFGGKLEIRRLKFWQMVFVLLVVQAQPGDFRNWPFIKSWAFELGQKLQALIRPE